MPVDWTVYQFIATQNVGPLQASRILHILYVFKLNWHFQFYLIAVLYAPHQIYYRVFDHYYPRDHNRLT